MLKTQQRTLGFSLTELMVVMAVGLLIFSGVIGLLMVSDETVGDTVQRGEMQENGRLALTLISRDIAMSGYWGRFTGMNIHEASGADIQAVQLNQFDGNKVAVSGTDCIGGGENNRTFFIENSDFYFRNIWGSHVQSSEIYNKCITDAKTGSDSIQIKRILGQEITAGNESDRRYYFISSDNQGVFYSGSDPTPNIQNGLIAEYQHHIYYITEEKRGDAIIPTLKRKYLYKAEDSTANQAKLKSFSLVEGIEQLGFLYGIDDDNDGVVNYYASADKLTREHWEGDGYDILSIQVHILVRALEPAARVNNTKTYDLGSYSVTVNDNYRRLLLINTISIINAGAEVWRS